METTESIEKVTLVSFLVDRVDGWSREQAENWFGAINNDPSSLSHEELIEPLAATGGEICLQVDWKDGDGIWYYTVRPTPENETTLFQYYDGTVETAHDEAQSRFIQDLGHKSANVVPIKRENSPFKGYEFK